MVLNLVSNPTFQLLLPLKSSVRAKHCASASAAEDWRGCRPGSQEEAYRLPVVHWRTKGTERNKGFDSTQKRKVDTFKIGNTHVYTARHSPHLLYYWQSVHVSISSTCM